MLVLHGPLGFYSHLNISSTHISCSKRFVLAHQAGLLSFCLFA